MFVFRQSPVASCPVCFSAITFISLTLLILLFISLYENAYTDISLAVWPQFIPKQQLQWRTVPWTFPTQTLSLDRQLLFLSCLSALPQILSFKDVHTGSTVLFHFRHSSTFFPSTVSTSSIPSSPKPSRLSYSINIANCQAVFGKHISQWLPLWRTLSLAPFHLACFKAHLYIPKKPHVLSNVKKDLFRRCTTLHVMLIFAKAVYCSQCTFLLFYIFHTVYHTLPIISVLRKCCVVN